VLKVTVCADKASVQDIDLLKSQFEAVVDEFMADGGKFDSRVTSLSTPSK